MGKNNNPETLKIPAYMRKKAIVTQSRQKLIMTALDRKEAGVGPQSKRKTMRKRASSSSTNPSSFPDPSLEETTSTELSSTPRTLQTAEATLADHPATTSLPLPTKAHKFRSAGIVTHYLDNISVAIIQLTKPLKQGDQLLIEGADSIALQPVEEMQIDRQPVTRAAKGAHIGLKIKFPAQVQGKVYKIKD